MRFCAILLLASGCWSTSFVRTDPAFRARPGRPPPAVYVDRLPDRPYRSVGIIEVTGPAADFSLGRIVREARARGAKLGCDVVVDRGIHRVTWAIPGAGPLLAQYQPYGQPTYYTPPPSTHTPTPVYQAPPPGRREFICGVWLEG